MRFSVSFATVHMTITALRAIALKIRCTVFKEENFSERSKNLHSLDLEEQKSDRLHVRGVKENNALNDSLYFNVAENRMIDFMHIFPKE